MGAASESLQQLCRLTFTRPPLNEKSKSWSLQENFWDKLWSCRNLLINILLRIQEGVWERFIWYFPLCCLVAKSCPVFCNHMNCSPPGSSVHRISQTIVLEWVAIPSPGNLPKPGIPPASSALEADPFPLSFLGSSNYMLCKPLFRYGTGLHTKETAPKN